jgi:hypothetical protein
MKRARGRITIPKLEAEIRRWSRPGTKTLSPRSDIAIRISCTATFTSRHRARSDRSATRRRSCAGCAAA